MPTAMSYVPADCLINHLYKGEAIGIYHCYKNNCVEDGERTYWYSVNEDSDEDDQETTFDIRDLPGYVNDIEESRKEFIDFICASMDAGHLDKWIVNRSKEQPCVQYQ